MKTAKTKTWQKRVSLKMLKALFYPEAEDRTLFKNE